MKPLAADERVKRWLTGYERAVAMAKTVAMDAPSSPSGLIPKFHHRAQKGARGPVKSAAGGGDQFPDSSDDDNDDGDADDGSLGLDEAVNPLLGAAARAAEARAIRAASRAAAKSSVPEPSRDGPPADESDDAGSDFSDADLDAIIAAVGFSDSELSEHGVTQADIDRLIHESGCGGVGPVAGPADPADPVIGAPSAGAGSAVPAQLPVPAGSRFVSYRNDAGALVDIDKRRLCSLLAGFGPKVSADKTTRVKEASKRKF